MESLTIYCWQSVCWWCIRFCSASRLSATFTLAVATSFWRAGFAIAASTAATSDCSRLAPFFLSVDQRVALCTDATSSAPADCARQAHAAAPRGSGLAHHLVLELCAGVVSSIPANCVARLSRAAAKALSPELQVELCKNAHSDAPARCVQQALESKRQASLLVSVCKGASSTGPADCLELLPRTVEGEIAARLCNGVQTAGPAICTSFRGLVSQYGWNLATRLCEDARGQGPAECFHRTSLVTKFSTDDRVELCIGATSDAPARCAGDIRDQRLSSRERVALCRGSSSTSPARCIAHLPPTVGTTDRVMLCQGAAEPHSLAPTRCLKKVLQHLPASLGAALCRGTSDSTAADCANVARHVVKDHDALLALCRGASSNTPAECAKAAMRAGAQEHLVADLCANANSTAPATCFAKAPDQMSVELRARTCAGALSVAPAFCLVAAMPRGINVKSSDDGVCPLDPEARGPPRRGLGHELASRLCKYASSNAPAHCGMEAPRQMNDDNVEKLCSAVGAPKIPGTTQCAATAVMAGLSGLDAAVVCRGATSNAPAVCAATVAHRIETSMRIDVCVGATSDAPARCINSPPVTRAPTPSEVMICRTTEPRPAGLHISTLEHHGEALFPDQPIQATLEIRDQWGGRMPSESSSVVRASIALRGSNGATVNAHGRFNTTSDGVVHFSHLSFSGAGNLTLQFSIDGDGDNGMRVPLASARVIVAEAEHVVIFRRCGRVFLSLACPLSAAEYSRDEAAKGENESFGLAEAVAIVVGMATAWDVLSCHNILAENGVQTAVVSGGQANSLTAWIWYHPGMEKLETGVGLPTRQQTAWERLGIERDATEREIRRAYYRQALLWHPDRWVRHSMHSARAQDIFEIVSEAYLWMVSHRPQTVEPDEQY